MTTEKPPPTEVLDAVGRLAGAGTRIVAVDGAGGSGKTTLAREVARRVAGVRLVHGDDFYRPMPEAERRELDAEGGYRWYFDWERLAAEVLRPLRDGGGPVRYRRYDWGSGDLGERAEVAPGGLVVVEGVYAARPELADLYDLTVYVDTPREVCLERLRARGENSEEWILRWRAAEDHYLATTDPASRADVVVRGWWSRARGRASSSGRSGRCGGAASGG
ncbi:AAA family ATPase [Streptomyces capparidis]